MGRPLTGSLRCQRGTWWASLPEAKAAASGRRDEPFPAEDDARAWLAQAVTALQADQPLPDPERFRHPQAPAATPSRPRLSRPRSSPTSPRWRTPG